MKFKKNKIPYLLLTPLVIIMIVFIFCPLIITTIDSFKSINLLKPNDVRFVGLSNYTNLLKNKDVIHCIKNSGIYFVLAVTAEIIGGLLVALAIKNKVKGRGFLLAVVILPWALPPVVNGVIWRWIYHPSYGLLNDILFKLGLINEFQVWLGKAKITLILVTLVHVWKMIPLAAVIILANLQAIPEEVYEAAKIDGGSRFQIFRYITLPLLKPAIAIVLTKGTFSAMHIFDEIYVLTGTDLDTRSILIQNYLIAFNKLKLSSGMALSIIITLIALGFTILYSFLQKKGDRA